MFHKDQFYNKSDVKDELTKRIILSLIVLHGHNEFIIYV
jgi:hypothetical protein